MKRIVLARIRNSPPTDNSAQENPEAYNPDGRRLHLAMSINKTLCERCRNHYHLSLKHTMHLMDCKYRYCNCPECSVISTGSLPQLDKISIYPDGRRLHLEQSTNKNYCDRCRKHGILKKCNRKHRLHDCYFRHCNCHACSVMDPASIPPLDKISLNPDDSRRHLAMRINTNNCDRCGNHGISNRKHPFVDCNFRNCNCDLCSVMDPAHARSIILLEQEEARQQREDELRKSSPPTDSSGFAEDCTADIDSLTRQNLLDILGTSG